MSRWHTTDEKLQAVRSNWWRPYWDVADEFEVHPDTVRRWVREHDAGKWGVKVLKRRPTKYTADGRRYYPKDWKLPYEYEAGVDWYIVDVAPAKTA